MMDKKDIEYLDGKFNGVYNKIDTVIESIHAVDKCTVENKGKIDGHINDLLRHKELKVPCKPLENHLKDHGIIKKEKSAFRIAIWTVVITGSIGGVFSIITFLVGK